MAMQMESRSSYSKIEGQEKEKEKGISMPKFPLSMQLPWFYEVQ